MSSWVLTDVDDYPERLLRQLAQIREHIRMLEERLADEAGEQPSPPPEVSAVAKVLHVLSRFSRVANHLKIRRDSRPPLLMADEYDVQYLIHALLDVHFDDVRPEDCGPSHAGKNVRIDFILEGEKIAVEAKKTRDGLRDKEVGDELLIDIARYAKHPSCKTLVCFVYDPEYLLRNPDGLENDLTRLHNGLDVRVLVRPKH
jgi:hypothetical protein